MNLRFQQIIKRLIDQSMTLDAALPFKGGGDDLDGEMAFARPSLLGMACVLGAVIDDDKALRGESPGQAIFNLLLYAGHCHPLFIVRQAGAPHT